MKLARSAVLLSALALAAIVSATPSVTVVTTFRIADYRTTPLAVNDLGQMVGFRNYSGTFVAGTKTRKYEGWSAFITGNEGVSALEVLPITGTGMATSGRCKGFVFTNGLAAVNADGIAVGESTVSSGSGSSLVYSQHAVIYNSGVLTDLGTLGDASGNSTATGVNASGLVVGSSTTASRAIHAFSYTNTTTTDLGTLGGKFSAAAAVNDAGTIVGGSSLAKSGLHPFSYSGGKMTDLGLPTGFSNASATAISSTGTIVGWGNSGASLASFSWSGGTFTKLTGLYTAGKRKVPTPFQAQGVNAAGVIVGTTLNSNGKPRGFVTVAGTPYDLTSLLPSDFVAWTVVSANAITDSGYVSAVALDATGKQFAILLKIVS